MSHNHRQNNHSEACLPLLMCRFSPTYTAIVNFYLTNLSLASEISSHHLPCRHSTPVHVLRRLCRSGHNEVPSVAEDTSFHLSRTAEHPKLAFRKRGALSVSVEDGCRGTEDETPIFDEPPISGTLATKAPPPLWQNATISALYPAQCDVEQLIMFIATEFGLTESPTFSLESDLFDEKDPETWIRQVRESFVPIIVGRIRISFPWHDLDPSFINLKLEPGCAFGTGEHPTTKLCLDWIQRTVKPNMTLLDFGTGSGVLAIAAVLYGEGVQAVGVDLDVNAVQTAKSNAERNQVVDKVTFCENRDEPQNKKYDVIVANILAEPLKYLAAKLVHQMTPGASIGLAGVLCSQAVDVMESYQREGVMLQQAEVNNEWALLIGRKP